MNSSIDVKDNETLSSRLEHLVGNKFGSDLSFIIEDTNESIPAHKIIVSLSSPVLHKMVYGNGTFAPSDTIKVDDISKEFFMQILLYIYTDRINLNEDNVFDILQKSNYFGLVGIETKCFEYLQEILSTSTFPWMYHQLVFRSFGSSKVLDKCFQYIRIQPLKFFASEYFEIFRVDQLKPVFKLDAINCNEVDLFEAMVRLSKAHCAASDLEITAENQRKILNGTESLLRLESLTESEFDECLAIQKNFYSTAEIERFRSNIRKAVAPVKRHWYTYQDAVWIEINKYEEGPPSVFYTGSYKCFVHRRCKEGERPQVCEHYFEFPKIEILCGSGYEWHKCENGKIPLGSVPVSLDHSEPLFIARGRGPFPRYTVIGLASMIGELQILTPNLFNEGRTQCTKLTEFEILVATNNVKHPYNGDGVPSDAIFIDYDEDNCKIYLGRAWYHDNLLPAKVKFRLESEPSVSYDGSERQVNEFEFVRMGPRTYKWEQSKNGKVPANAVIAGYDVDEAENVYFGRVLHHGRYIPGKVHPTHGVLYVPFRGEEIFFRLYDVLVHVKSHKFK